MRWDECAPGRMVFTRINNEPKEIVFLNLACGLVMLSDGLWYHPNTLYCPIKSNRERETKKIRQQMANRPKSRGFFSKLLDYLGHIF